MKPADKKEEILEAALTLFSKFGYDGTSFSQIAKHVGLTKGGIYHHFQSKEELFNQLHEYSMIKDLVPVIENARKIQSPKERVCYCIQQVTRIMAQSRAARVLLQELGRIRWRERKKIKQVYRTAFELIRDSIIELKEAGKIKEVNPTFASFAAFGMCFWLLYWFDYSRPNNEESSEELGRLFCEIFLTGILTEGEKTKTEA